MWTPSFSSLMGELQTAEDGMKNAKCKMKNAR
jgi:hypothetical protein